MTRKGMVEECRRLARALFERELEAALRRARRQLRLVVRQVGGR